MECSVRSLDDVPALVVKSRATVKKTGAADGPGGREEYGLHVHLGAPDL